MCVVVVATTQNPSGRFRGKHQFCVTELPSCDCLMLDNTIVDDGLKF